MSTSDYGLPITRPEILMYIDMCRELKHGRGNDTFISEFKRFGNNIPTIQKNVERIIAADPVLHYYYQQYSRIMTGLHNLPPHMKRTLRKTAELRINTPPFTTDLGQELRRTHEKITDLESLLDREIEHKSGEINGMREYLAGKDAFYHQHATKGFIENSDFENYMRTSIVCTTLWSAYSERAALLSNSEKRPAA